MNDEDQGDWLRFKHLVLPHIDNAFNLALWLLRSHEDAKDDRRPRQQGDRCDHVDSHWHSHVLASPSRRLYSVLANSTHKEAVREV